MNNYDIFSDVYDIDFGTVTKDVRMYKKLLTPNACVLILSCGTGREMVYLSDICSRLVGLDISEGMLSKAKIKKYNCDNVDFYCNDMSNFNLNEKFDYIIIPNNGLLHLLSNEEVENCFCAVSKHLNPNGKLLLDFFLPLDIKSNPNTIIFDYHKYNPDIEKDVIRTRIVEKNPVTRLSTTKVFYEFIDKYGIVEKKIYEYTIRYLFPDDIKMISRLTGFIVDNMYGNYTDEEFSNNHTSTLFKLALKNN